MLLLEPLEHKQIPTTACDLQEAQPSWGAGGAHMEAGSSD